MKPKNTDRLYYSLWGVIALFLLLTPTAQAEEDSEHLTVRNIVALGNTNAARKSDMEFYLAGIAAGDRVHRFKLMMAEVANDPSYDPAAWTEPMPVVAYEYFTDCGVWSGEVLYVLAQLAVLNDAENADHAPAAFVVNLNTEKCGKPESWEIKR